MTHSTHNSHNNSHNTSHGYAPVKSDFWSMLKTSKKIRSTR